MSPNPWAHLQSPLPSLHWILASLALTACDALDTLNPTPPGDAAQLARDMALAPGMEIDIVSTGLVGMLRPR